MARGCYLLAVCMLAALFARAASVGSGGGERRSITSSTLRLAFHRTVYWRSHGDLWPVHVCECVPVLKFL